MGMIDRIRARRAEGRGFLAWLDRIGPRKAAAFGLDLFATIRGARKGSDDPAVRLAESARDGLERADGAP